MQIAVMMDFYIIQSFAETFLPFFKKDNSLNSKFKERTHLGSQIQICIKKRN